MAKTLLPRRALSLAIGWTALSASAGLATAAQAGDRPPIFRNASRHQFTYIEPPSPAPGVVLSDLMQNPIAVRAGQGKLMVVAFWASWCAPCLQELPALDRLAAIANPDHVEVLAVSIDDAGAQQIRQLAAKLSLTRLQILTDPGQRFGTLTRAGLRAGALPVFSLPTTYVITPRGSVAGYITGPSDWSSPQASALLTYLSER